MTAYAFWNNKGGVGKTYLSFIAASEYANTNKDTDVYVIDLCPQANVSETLLGGHENSAKAIKDLVGASPRKTIAGYLEARLNSPFSPIENVEEFITRPFDYNSKIPENLYLICGDYFVEILAEAIRQTSSLPIPFDAWKKVMEWVKDLVNSLKSISPERDSIFIIDCNPSFSIYTQLALVAADKLIVPYTADDSSRRAIENIFALLYGVGDQRTEAYAKLSFSKKATENFVIQPKLYTFISNRQTIFDGEPSKAFKAINQIIKDMVNQHHKKHKNYFSISRKHASESFVEIPDYHGACIVSAFTGTPLFKLKAGPKIIGGERVQINSEPLKKYKHALSDFVGLL
ncbi:ParA family protein [Pseudomonas oryzihabitans]|uniref:ParA family protein n=1 Tax=Pseudomonas oryzihabitans TaxID=47885 RepID=UPI00289F556C|nr:ParA family protein [Pseudomonas oryzihabitans]